MVFASLTFLYCFLAVTLILMWIVPKKLKNLVLLLASLVFYFWGEKLYVWILVFSTVFDYVNGRLIGHFQKTNKKKAAKAILILSVVGNLAILCTFKYSDFFLQNLNHLGLNLKLLGLTLPIGISFYTFQTMSYTIDVYRGEVEVQNNIIAFGTYVTMFPQLIAGPIVRYKNVEQEMNERRITVEDYAAGIRRFVIGLAKKVLLANAAGSVYDTVSQHTSATGAMLWFAGLMYMFQIYFDFSGYSDMAIGLGRMFGFHFPENFNYPYIATSITDFWRRWHITLSTWFREYVYIPLGGNRVGKAKQIRNFLIVWALTGFWHGASWNFVLWGLYFFVLLTLEKFIFGKALSKLPGFVQHLYALVFVFFGWILFSHVELSGIGSTLQGMFGFGKQPFMNREAAYLLYTNLVLTVCLVLGSTELPKKLWGRVENTLSSENHEPSIGLIVLKNAVLALLFLLCVACLLRESYNPFLYFRF